MHYDYHPGVRLAVAHMQRGGIIAYPTEAVWGLGCDPFDRVAVEQLLALKRRDPEKGLIMVAADIRQLGFLLAGVSNHQRETLAASWPGPNTWLIPHCDRIPPWVTGAHLTVAVRVSAHPVVRALCRLYGGPIVSTSANPQGSLPARHGFQARAYFGASVRYSPGRVGAHARPSTIRELSTGQVVRA